MKKIKLISCLLSTVISLGLFCSCSIPSSFQGPQGEQGIQGIQGEQGPAGKDGASFLTGNGQPSNELGKVGDSYLDLSADDWGFYIKNEDGWKLMGYIESTPAPLTLNDLNGSYSLSHIVSGSIVYNIGDTCFGLTLTSDMIQVELNNGIGHLSVNMINVADTDITCTIESDKLIMTCEEAIKIAGQPNSVYELAIVVEDGTIYTVLEAYGDYYYVKKNN